MYSEQAALFLDRDGTLIVDRGYLSDPEGVQLLPGVREFLAKLKAKNWLFFLHSNQSGVNRGFFTMSEVNQCNRRLIELLDLGEDVFARVCCAVGTPDNPCPYRKPSPKFTLECLEEFNLNPNKCWMIGDRISDVETGQAAHIHSILLTQKPQEIENCFCCRNFEEIFEILQKH